jgi:hypothetical protein
VLKRVANGDCRLRSRAMRNRLIHIRDNISCKFNRGVVRHRGANQSGAVRLLPAGRTGTARPSNWRQRLLGVRPPATATDTPNAVRSLSRSSVLQHVLTAVRTPTSQEYPSRDHAHGSAQHVFPMPVLTRGCRAGFADSSKSACIPARSAPLTRQRSPRVLSHNRKWSHSCRLTPGFSGCEDAAESVCRLVLHVWQDVAVGVKRDADARMS